MADMTPEAIKNDKELGLPLIPVKAVYLDAEFNCRGAFSPVECTELAKDIARRGLQQPIVVRPLRDEDAEEKHLIRRGFIYKMIAGHRRLTAYKINNHHELPSIIKSKDISDFDARDINAVENLQRKELNLLQECNAIRHYWMAAWSREETAERIGKSPGWVQIRYMLLEMPEEIQEAAGQGYINTTDVRELNKYKNPTEQLRLAGIIRDKRKAGVGKNVTDAIRKKDKASAKKHRGRAQIFEMIGYVQEACKGADQDALIEIAQVNTVGGNNIGTSCLAWCAGEITTIDFHQRLKEYCDQLGIFYELPEFESEFV